MSWGQLVAGLRALWAGIRLRCPYCGRGRLFERAFHMRATCAYCDARFSRARGEFVGAVYLSSTLTLVLALAGFFSLEAWLDPPLALQLALWIGFALLFPMLFFHTARGLWVAIAYLTGGVYPDPDYERQWVSPEARRAAAKRRARRE
ncbi:MAG: DUF983 domain-containing protein [Chloroflexota bacterium]